MIMSVLSAASEGEPLQISDSVMIQIDQSGKRANWQVLSVTLTELPQSLGWKLVPTNDYGSITEDISVHGQKLETLQQFKYLGVINSDQGLRPEILARTAQTMTALFKLKTIWRGSAISMQYKIRLLCALVFSIFLYAFETDAHC